jgi:hypothetical protein
MPARWKKKETEAAPHILNALYESITPNGRSGFSSQSLEIHQALHALESMIDFPGSPGLIDTRETVIRAVGEACNKQDLSATAFIDCINAEIKKACSRPEEEFRILTTASISPRAATGTYTINDVRISGCSDTHFPKKYKSRLDALRQPHIRGLGIKDHSKYHHLILSVKAKSPLAAMSAGIESLDLLRACWCIYANPSLSIGSHERNPINTVRLGAFHTIHAANGCLAIDDPWYEPGFVSCRPFVPNSPNSDATFKKSISRLLTRLKSPKMPIDFRQRIASSLLLFVRAFDDPNPSTAFMGAWTTLERLCLIGQNEGYEKIVERCSVLFKDDRMFHRSMLIHLRERRNEYAHDGIMTNNAKLLCYQAQSYIKSMLSYLFFAANHFNRTEDALSLLSLRPDPDVIGKEIAARKFFAKHLIP